MDEDARGASIDKLPGARSESWMAVLATGLLVLGTALGVAILAWSGLDGTTIVFTARKVLTIIFGVTGLTIATLLVHEGLHGLGMLLLGARPHFGAGIMAPGLPFLYTTSEGHLFRRWHYIAIAALPNVLLNALLLAMILWGPHAAWWVIPFAVHLSGGVGDAWLCWACLHEPPGTLVEDRREGLRAHRAGA